jgi:hypothetical protein
VKPESPFAAINSSAAQIGASLRSRGDGHVRPGRISNSCEGPLHEFGGGVEWTAPFCGKRADLLQYLIRKRDRVASTNVFRG